MTKGERPPAMEAFVAAVLRRRRAVEAGFLLLVALSMPGLLRLESDNAPEVFFLASGADAQAFASFEERFGAGDAVRLVLGGERLFERAGLLFVARLEEETAALAGVRSVSGPMGHHRELVAPADDPEGFRARLLANRLDRAVGLVSSSGRELSLLVELEPATGGAGREEARAARLAALERLAERAPPGATVDVVGPPTLERALDASSREIGRVYFPLLVALAALLLAAVFREVWAVAVPLAFVGAVEIVVLGAMGYAGVRLNLVVAILPPVLFVIALASAVHLLLRGRDLAAELTRELGGPVAATRETYRDKGRALLWTTLSTFAGFASLTATPIAPIRTLGLWAGAGLAFAGFAAFTLLPCLLVRAVGSGERLPERSFEVATQRLGRRLTEFAADRRRGLLTLYAGVAIVAAAGLPRLEVASNALAYLAPAHPARAAIERVEAQGLGLSTLELTIALDPAKEPTGFFAERRLAELRALGDEIAQLPGLLSVVGAADLLDDVGERSPLRGVFPPDELRARLVPLLFADRDGGRALGRLLTRDGSCARLTIFVPTAGYDRIDPVIEAVSAAAERAVPGAEAAVTGAFPRLLAMQRFLLSTLALSLLLTLPVLALTFYVLLRSVRGTLYALLPNLWPVLVLFGGMGWLGVPLDIATVMVASITLGLVVDDTIHTLAHHRTLSRALGERGAVADRMEKTAPAYLVTGLILAIGFGVCALSDFAPTARFGVLSALAILVAVAADFTLVPALFGRGAK